MGATPKEKTLWEHRNGNVYEVLAITNLPNEDRYPTTIVYRGSNGNLWSRRADDWHRSFRPFIPKVTP